jgi:hypothetical protein
MSLPVLGLVQSAAQTAPAWFNLNADAPPDLLGGFLICLFTLSVYSFLYRDNAFYKLAEHVFIGVATAWYTMEYYDSGVLEPLFKYISHTHEAIAHPGALPFKVGGYPVDPAWAIGWRLGAVVLSVMLLTRLVSRNAWISRWPLAMMVGIYAALKMTGETQAKLVDQVRETMVPLWGPTTSAYEVAGNVVLLVGMLAVLGHFVFTYRRNLPLRAASRIAIVVLMLAFGSRFAFTVLGRIALLIERVATLASYSEPGYSLARDASAEGGWLGTALTPPFLIGALIVLVLLLSAMTRRASGATAAPPS